MASLLDQFLSEEGTQAAQSRIRGALAGGQALQRLSFNRFDLTIDRDRQSVFIEDVTDATPAGTQRLSIAELIAKLAEKDEPE